MGELQRLQNENTHILQAITTLTNGMNQAAERLAAMLDQLPEKLVQVAMGELTQAELDTFRIELKTLENLTRDPVKAAISIAEKRLNPIREQIAKIHREQTMDKHRVSYQTARAAIIDKGSYTTHEWDEIQHLASNSGDENDLQRLKQALDDHYRDTQGLRPGYPAFQFD